MNFVNPSHNTHNPIDFDCCNDTYALVLFDASFPSDRFSYFKFNVILPLCTGRFLWTRTDDVDAAEEVLRKTLRLDDKSEVALYNLGALLFR